MVCCLGGYYEHGSQTSVRKLILFNIFINDPDDWIVQVGMSIWKKGLEFKRSWQIGEVV